MSLGFKHGHYMRRDTGHVTLTLHCIEILYEKVWIFGLCICVFTRFSSVFVKLLWKSICSLQISMYMKSISEKNSFHRFVLFIKSYIIQFFVSTKVRGLTKHVNLKTILIKRIQNGTDLVQNVRMKHDHTVILSDRTLKE